MVNQTEANALSLKYLVCVILCRLQHIEAIHDH